jgi:hypothetical protein
MTTIGLDLYKRESQLCIAEPSQRLHVAIFQPLCAPVPADLGCPSASPASLDGRRRNGRRDVAGKSRRR